jgi:Uma2 family endonuclease
MDSEVSTQPKGRITAGEYLELERNAEFRSEYLDGEMFAMSGASQEHNTIEVNILTEFNVQLGDRPCKVFGANMRTKVSPTGLYTYPDITIVCGEPQFEDDHLDTLLNPQAIIEVLSDSTESYDRGKKFAHYRQMASLQEYVLVSQYEPRVERFERSDDGSWRYSESVDPDGTVALTSVACRLPTQSIYRKVDFERARLRREKRPGDAE